MPLAQHIRIRTRDDSVIAATPEARRILANTVLRYGRETTLLAFSLADHHLHLQAACTHGVAGELARRIQLSLTRSLGLTAGFDPVYRKPIEDARHQRNVFHYLMKQAPHHGLDLDPLLEGTNLPDLLGLRVIGAYTAQNLRRRLPRLTRNELLAHLGLDELRPAHGPPELILDAAAAAMARPDINGKSPDALRARRAALDVASHLRPAELRSLLAISRASLYRLREMPADPAVVKAIRLQLGLMQHKRDALARAETFDAAL